MSSVTASPRILRGVVPPLLTPVTATNRIDEPSLRRLVQHLIEGGVHGLFVLGTTSEVASLPDPLRADVIRIALDEAAGRVPVAAGVIDMTTLRVIEHVKAAVAAGVEGLVVTAPFYMRTTAAETERHFRLIKEACPDTPLYAYDFPAVVGVKLEAESVLRLAEDGVIAGIKDSSGIDGSIRTLVLGRRARDLKHFTVLTGSESTVDSVLTMGADGVVGGLGNIDPAGFRRLLDHVAAGDLDAARVEQERLIALLGLTAVGDPRRMGGGSSALGAFKAALVHLGVLADARTAPPLTQLDGSEVAAVRPFLQRAGLLPA